MRSREGRPIEDVVQHTAPLNPGNSGGPLVDFTGRLVGVNTAIIAGAQGLSFAVPSETALWVVPEILKHGLVRRARLGVEVRQRLLDRRLARANALEQKHAVEIMRVAKDGPAHRAGLQEGNLMIGFQGRSVSSTDELFRRLSEEATGRVVYARVLRKGQIKTFANRPRDTLNRPLGVDASDDRATAEQERERRDHEEHEEEDLRDARGVAGDAAEAQERGDESDDEEDDGPPQHDDSPWFEFTSARRFSRKQAVRNVHVRVTSALSSPSAAPTARACYIRDVRSALVAGFAVLLASSLAAADVHQPDPSAAAAARRRRRRAPASPSVSATARGFVALKTPAPERILIRGGTFMMGSTDDEIEHARMICKREPLGEDGRCRLLSEDHGDDGEPPFSDEASQHEVMVSDFWLDRTEVTNARYRRCVAAGRCALPPYSAGAERFDRPDFPVVLVNWPEAVAFCEWDGGRLPTEAEWERAARGLDGRRYPWGDVYNPFLANHGQLAFDAHDAADGFVELAPVGSFPDGRTPEGSRTWPATSGSGSATGTRKEYPRVSAVNPKGPGRRRRARAARRQLREPAPTPPRRGPNAAPPGLRETHRRLPLRPPHRLRTGTAAADRFHVEVGEA